MKAPQEPSERICDCPECGWPEDECTCYGGAPWIETDEDEDEDEDE